MSNQSKPVIEKLPSPVRSGDWHDTPLKWDVRWYYDGGYKNQMFARRKDAERYARIWRKHGLRQEIEAINEYSATDPECPTVPVNPCRKAGCAISYPHAAHQ